MIMHGKIDVNEYEVSHFDIGKTLSSGQNIRACKGSDGRWLVSSGGRIARIRQTGNRLAIESAQGDSAYWRRLLSVDDDYERIWEELSAIGSPVLDEAMKSGDGIRILHQDPFEAFVTFIISQNNNIPRIRKCVESICAHSEEIPAPYGQMPSEGTRWVLHPFPDAESLLEILGTHGSDLRLGYRLPYLMNFCKAWMEGRFAEMVSASSNRRPFSSDEMESSQHDMGELMSHKGIGPKVASCCCLFGLGHASALPVDVWIRRFESKYDMPWVAEIAGIQQQYVFEWVRRQGRDTL